MNLGKWHQYYVKEKLTTLIAITTVILAVVATLASFKAAGYGNKMVLMQNQASDQWNFYQAKGIKETEYQTQRDMMLLVSGQFSNEALQQKIAEYDKTVQRYSKEKDEIMADAKKFEQERDQAKVFNSMFGQALIFLQVGILLTSLASINKTAAYWYMGGAFGLIGIFYFAYTMFLSL
ncbi:MAG: DUF4337 domain-containing protein [Sporomusaceae bacterium]|nr:DUF4337 domain-containing protein [Sporomusaceae bacterium]